MQMWSEKIKDKLIPHCGTRTVELTPKNRRYGYGFFEHTLRNEKYNRFFEAYPGYRLYGEWLSYEADKDSKLRIQYAYGAYDRFYVFDILDETYASPRWIPYLKYANILRKYNMNYVPISVQAPDPSIDVLTERYDKSDLLLPIRQKGTHGKGIILKNYDYENERGWGKEGTGWIKYNGSAVRLLSSPSSTIDVTKPFNSRLALVKQHNEIVDKYLTVELLDNQYNQLVSQHCGWKKSLITDYLKKVADQFVVTQMLAILKNTNPPPIIDFDLLKKLLVIRTKELRPSVFKDSTII